VCILIFAVVIVGNLAYVNHEVANDIARQETASAQFARKSAITEIDRRIAANNAQQQVLATRLARKVALAKIKAQVPTCKALRALDNASHGVKFAAPGKTGIPRAKAYGLHLSRAIHRVYLASKCGKLLKVYAGKRP